MFPDMISVIVLTYNDPARLRLCLHGMLRQTLHDFELLVVHDGGDREINRPVYEEMRQLGREIKEHWLGPPSAEFRAAAARNLGLRHVHGERVLFVDGDCILAPNVVAEHAAYGARPALVNGARNHLPRRCLKWLQPADFDHLEQYVKGRDARYQIVEDFNRELRDQLQKGRTDVVLTHYEQVWSFQLSVPTGLARQIGGFNEGFVGYGGEDQEFAARLNQAGAALVGRFDLVCYHLNHPSRREGKKGQEWMLRVRESVLNPSPVRNGGPMRGAAPLASP